MVTLYKETQSISLTFAAAAAKHWKVREDISLCGDSRDLMNPPVTSRRRPPAALR